eukprot:CAMPEP_0167783596 /NCGR_PEP_ID=MMETSP0111_2-20121227/7158_1 /TAXON_ID=91324 /ORGANISM="Lotharella globosa, Strain CCCM811" /LENGTH=75 /DNA_ID=CAMNT_0007674551 /DNA_START=88 /DNA_END=315 /DNA_ORIENTATION=+
MATETISPFPHDPNIKIKAEITKYDEATEKRMAALAAAETEKSPFHPSNLFPNPEGEVPKWTTNFWEICRKTMAH